MKKPFYTITNQGPTSAEIMIYGVIGSSFWEEGNDAKNFVKDFKRLEAQYDRIDVHINSPGGSVWDGLPMFNVIRASKKEIHTYNDGIAFSMGAMIFLAGKHRHASKGSLLMLHNVLGGAVGNADDLRNSAAMMDKHDDVLADLIAEQSGKDKDAVKSEWMNYKNHFFTATEAHENGFVTDLEEYEADGVPENVQNMAPLQLVAFYQQEDEPTPTFLAKVKNYVQEILTPQNQNTDMKFPKIEALVKLPTAQVTEELVNAVNTEIAEAEIEGVLMVLESEYTNLVEKAENVTKEKDGEIEKLNNEITELKAKLNKPAAEATTPAAEGDVIQKTGAEPAYNVTSVDKEKARLMAEWGN